MSIASDYVRFRPIAEVPLPGTSLGLQLLVGGNDGGFYFRVTPPGPGTVEREVGHALVGGVMVLPDTEGQRLAWGAADREPQVRVAARRLGRTQLTELPVVHLGEQLWAAVVPLGARELRVELGGVGEVRDLQ